MIKQSLSVGQVQLQPGARGEFTVWVGERCVAEKDSAGFPDFDEAVEQVREALGPDREAEA